MKQNITRAIEDHYYSALSRLRRLLLRVSLLRTLSEKRLRAQKAAFDTDFDTLTRSR